MSPIEAIAGTITSNMKCDKADNNLKCDKTDKSKRISHDLKKTKVQYHIYIFSSVFFKKYFYKIYIPEIIRI